MHAYQFYITISISHQVI